jgi:hypothetical protein
MRLNKLFTPDGSGAAQATETEEVTERMGINHLPGPKRFQLTKKITLDDCFQRFGVSVLVKGVYQPPDSEPDLANEPIHLELRGPSLSTVNACIKHLKDLLMAEDSAPTHTGKVFIPIPGKSPFNVVAKLVGPSGEFVKHIKKQANCQVQVAGKDCGLKAHESDEDLHIRLDAHSAEGLVKAKQLTQDLVDHVVQQYGEWMATMPSNAAKQQPVYMNQSGMNPMGYGGGSAMGFGGLPGPPRPPVASPYYSPAQQFGSVYSPMQNVHQFAPPQRPPPPPPPVRQAGAPPPPPLPPTSSEPEQKRYRPGE